jgi:hypothetical protein
MVVDWDMTRGDMLCASYRAIELESGHMGFGTRLRSCELISSYYGLRLKVRILFRYASTSICVSVRLCSIFNTLLTVLCTAGSVMQNSTLEKVCGLQMHFIGAPRTNTVPRSVDVPQ